MYVQPTLLRKRNFFLTILLLTVWTALALAATSPTKAIQSTTNSLLAVLEDSTLSAAGKTAERRAQLEAIVVKRFDYDEMAKRTLAKHWKARSSQEKEEFTILLQQLLLNSYITIIESRTDEQVNYLDELIKNDFAMVKTQIVAKSGKIPVEYRMRNKKETWRVYDVVIQGVSLVGNFRKQFDRIIRTESFAALTIRLKEKTTTSPSP